MQLSQYFILILLFVSLFAQSVDAKVNEYSNLKDPTSPYTRGVNEAGNKDKQTKPKLTSILFSTDRKLAVVNGKFMSEGESHNGVMLEKIHADSVLVRTNEGLAWLHLGVGAMHKEIRK